VVAAVSTLAIVVAVASVVAAAGAPPSMTLAAVPTTRAATPTPSAHHTPSATPTPTSSTTPADNAGGGGGPIIAGNPAPGSGQWQYAGDGPTFGFGGSMWTYRVAVEEGLPVSLGEFTAMVDATLGDPRGWTGRGERLFQRVSGAASFTVYLASPWTAYNLCRGVVDIRIGGVPYTNCQAGGPVVINSDRYLSGASAFTGGLDVYRRYVINHEVGHRLGFAHQSCPGSGQLAPVMQQQTLGMQGCQPNAWPFPEIPAPPEPVPTTETATTPPPTTPPPSTTPPPTSTGPPSSPTPQASTTTPVP
jgi:Protein of unknown function (DUF3152)